MIPGSFKSLQYNLLTQPKLYVRGYSKIRVQIRGRGRGVEK
jgi:hypothetical protein